MVLGGRVMVVAEMRVVREPDNVMKDVAVVPGRVVTDPGS